MLFKWTVKALWKDHVPHDQNPSTGTDFIDCDIPDDAALPHIGATKSQKKCYCPLFSPCICSLRKLQAKVIMKDGLKNGTFQDGIHGDGQSKCEGELEQVQARDAEFIAVEKGRHEMDLGDQGGQQAVDGDDEAEDPDEILEKTIEITDLDIMTEEQLLAHMKQLLQDQITTESAKYLEMARESLEFYSSESFPSEDGDNDQD